MNIRKIAFFFLMFWIAASGALALMVVALDLVAMPRPAELAKVAAHYSSRIASVAP